MGDHRAGPTGTTATQPTVPGKRAARHAVEQRTSQPYIGRRVAGRATPPGRRIAAPVVLEDLEDVSAHLVAPTSLPVPTAYAGRRVALPRFELVEVSLAPVETVAAPPVVEPVVEPVEEPVVEPVVELAPEPVVEAAPVDVPPPSTPAVLRSTRPGGRRAAARRTRVPSLPLLAGVAVLAISAGGALQAMHPAVADADGRISPASALSGSSALGAAGLADRGVPVSRDSDRTSSASLQAAADAQAKQRDEFLAALRGKAEAQSAKIRLHRWVLPVAPGVYHLTARFGDYSSLWANFHTGLDFAAPTGTPIMAVAGGTITEIGYSGAYGNRTIEKLPDGTELWYCHQNEFGTQVGAKVQPGQVIGYVGSTGNVTGPHLHLEVHPDGGDPVDPYPVLVAHGLYPGPPA
jgi:murein DD-endopeptidase MepM/ murein hydrolase activator NlpD